MAGCQKRGVILPKITSKKVSLFPALTLAHLHLQRCQTNPKTHTDSALPGRQQLKFKTRCVTEGREQNYIPACPFWIKFWLCTQQSAWKITATAGETLSCSASELRAAEDNRWDFTRESNSCSLPAHSWRKLPPLRGIKGNHPHRNVEVVRLQWRGKNTEIYTWSNCHHRALEVHDCSAKHNILIFFFCVWENSVLQQA